MKLVVDANILFAALIKNHVTRRLLLFLDHELYAPEFILDEVYEHMAELEFKTGLSSVKIKEILEELIKDAKIALVPANQFKTKLSEGKASVVDSDDVPYIALALYLSCPVWSNDKNLKKQSEVKIISTEEVMAGLTS